MKDIQEGMLRAGDWKEICFRCKEFEQKSDTVNGVCLKEHECKKVWATLEKMKEVTRVGKNFFLITDDGSYEVTMKQYEKLRFKEEKRK